MRAWTRAMGDETTRGVGLGRMRRRRRRGGVRARDAGEWWFVDDVEDCVGYEEGECSRASSRARGAVEEIGGEGAPRRGAKSARGSRE